MRLFAPIVLLIPWLLVVHQAGFAAGAGQVRLEDLPARLVRLLEEEAADSVRALVSADRLGSLAVVESLLVERAQAILTDREGFAERRLAQARTLARLSAGEFHDSLCLHIVSWHETLSPAALERDVAGWQRYRAAAARYRRSEWPRALDLLPEVAILAREARDPYLEGYAHRLAGGCYLMTGRFENARESYEQALLMAQQVGDEIGATRTLRNLAVAYQQQGIDEKATAVLRQVVERARGVGDRELFAGTLSSIGINLWRRGELDSALIVFEEALSSARGDGFKYLEAAILPNLGGVLGDLGEYERAIECQELALQAAQEAGTRSKHQELSARILLAKLCIETEQYSRALVALRSALPVAEETGSVETAAVIRGQIGEMHSNLGRPDKALRAYEDVLPSIRSLRVPHHLAWILINIGMVLTDLGRTAEAREALEEAVAVAETGDDPSPIMRAGALTRLGWIEMQGGDLDRAAASLRRALAVAEEMGNPLLTGQAEGALGQVLARRGEDDQALAFFDRALERGRSIKSPDLVRHALADKAKWLREQGALAQADALLAEAIDVVESVRGDLTGESVRLGFHSDKKGVYSSRIGVLHELGERQALKDRYHREAFLVVEKSKVRSLLDVLGRTRLGVGKDVDPILRQEERTLWARLGRAQAELSRAESAERWDVARIDSLRRDSEEHARRYRQVADELAARIPAYGAATGGREPIGVEEVQTRVLLPGQILLEYLVGESESHLFVVGHDHYRLVRIPVGSDTLDALVGALRQSVLQDGSEGGGGDHDAFHATSTRLYSLLLGPVAGELPEEARLLIVPDGPLYHLPFALLEDADGFLIERHAIAYAPSASVLDPRIQRKTASQPGPLLAVGNPQTYRSGEILSSVRSDQGWRFGELPSADEEVRRVAGHAARAIVLTGAAATEEAVKSAIDGAGFVHFATHGLLNEREPLLSGIALAQDEDPKEDGFLQANEILHMRIPADLVVLSACNTGLGRLAGGEGVQGLTRSFLHAGARRVVISLWEVRDRSTVDLMESFYRAFLRDRLAGDETLRKAQLELIDRGAPARDWAAFLFVGPAGPAPSTKSHGPDIRVVVGALFLLATLAILVACARRRRMRPPSSPA